MCLQVGTKGFLRDGWYLDSGASSHMTNNKQLLTDFNDKVSGMVSVADGRQLKIKGRGEVQLIPNYTEDKEIRLENVLYVPEPDSNLLSISSITKKGCQVNFSDNACEIKKGNNVLLAARLGGKLYKMEETHKAYTVQVKKAVALYT